MDNKWIMEQSKTSHHKMAIYLLPLVVFLGYLHPALFVTGIIIFFLLTSFKMLKSMLFWMLILGGISLLLPFLAPVIFIVMIVLFFLRIGYVIQNWRPFLSGILLYGMSAILIARSFYLLSFSSGSLLLSSIIEGIVMSVLSLIFLRYILRWLYQFNYSSYAALGIMGSVPVIIIAFVLPFLKLHIGGEFFSTETAIETKPVNGQTSVGTSEAIGTRTIAPTSQNIIQVNEYIRTAPDGELTNNFSYNGPDKTTPNEKIVKVESHLRTTPDADLTNNLSYRDASNIEEASIDTKLDKSTKDKIIDQTQATVTGQVAIDRLVEALKKENKEEQ